MPYVNPYMSQPVGQQATYQYLPASNPYGMAAQQQPVHGFVYVTGLEGARAYHMPPNSEMPLFDSTSDGVMFIKKTDGAGYPTITVVDCKERQSDARQANDEYVTRDEMDRTYRDLASQLEQLRGVIHGLVPTTAAAAAAAPQQDAGPAPADVRQPARHVSAAPQL